MAVITISRQFGAGGKTLAQNVADRLGYKIAHEEIIEKVAEKAKVSADSLRSFEAEARGLLQRATSLLTPNRFIDHVLDPRRNYMDGDLYIDLLRKIIPEIADEGNIVILGRGSQFILMGRPDTVHVLLVANQEDRIRFMREQYDLTESLARDAVRKQGRRREQLMRLFGHGDYDQPIYYDLVINLSKVSIDGAVELVCESVSPVAKAS